MALSKLLQWWYWLIGGVCILNLILFIMLTRRPSSQLEDSDNNNNRVLTKNLLHQLDLIKSQLNDQIGMHESILQAINSEQANLIRDIVQRRGTAEDQLVLKQLTAQKTPVRLKPKPVPDLPHKPTQLGQDATFHDAVIPILMMACNRVTVRRSLDMLFKYRPVEIAHRFPIIVSQDCGHVPTAEVIRSYGDRLKHIQQPDQSNIKLPYNKIRFIGYYRIARHYKWALNQVFISMNHSAAIIVEDDLDIASDFFEYFAATYPVLKRDPTLWCVSAWNDNGKAKLVSNEPELLYRTDFFPGLGWMIVQNTWKEIAPKWPDTFWDEFMRQPDIRRERSCIRPEISRSITFGRKGVSNGQYFDAHLRFIQLNSHFVPFTRMDVSYLEQGPFDNLWRRKVYQDSRLVKTGELKAITSARSESCVRVEYTTQKEFVQISKLVGAMEDFKAGVPRTAYKGVVTVVHNGVRIFIAPPMTWAGYNISWK